MSTENHAGHIFIIDTDSYSGNFERQMCAYITGAVGDCGVGEEEAKVFEKENQMKFNDFSDYLELEPDEHGTYRPCSIWMTPGYWNDGLGNHHPDSEKDSPKAKRLYNATAKKHKMKAGKMYNAPAYQSVAIFWNSGDYSEPERKELEFMMDRARKFVAYWKENGIYKSKEIKILGFRLIERTVDITVKDIASWKAEY